MKRLIAASAALFLLIGAAQAQTQDSTKAVKHWAQRPGFNKGTQQFRQGQGGPGPQHQGQRGSFARGGMKHKRGFGNMPRLTPEQQKQARVINTDYSKKLSALQQNDNMSLGDFKKQSAALRKDRTQKIQALYTPEQKDRIAKGKKRMEDNMKVMAAARMERMKLNLDLKDDQIAKIKSQQENFRSQAKAIRQNDDLLPEQKREQFKGLMAQQKESIKSVLTPDQQSKFDSLHKHDFRGGNRPWGGGRGDRQGAPMTK